MKFLLALLPTVMLVVYGQLVTKWRVAKIATAVAPDAGVAARLFAYLSDPLVLSAYVAVFASSLSWMFVVDRYPLSQAFPVHIGVTFMLVVIGSARLLGEVISPTRVAAILLIVAGVVLGSRG